MRFQFSFHYKPTTEHWRDLAQRWHLSHKARGRLEWMIFYHTVGKRNVSATARYFGVSRKTLHHWKKRFNPRFIQSLEEHARAPKQKRVWTVTPEEEQRVIALRLAHLKWGKKKLQEKYREIHHQRLSTNKIQKVIVRHHLYPDPAEHEKQVRRFKRRIHEKKVRIHELRKTGVPGILWHIDGIILWWYGVRRVIFTAIEEHTRVGIAHVYDRGTSTQAADFLKRVVYVSGETVELIHSDNGGEFKRVFAQACRELGIQQVYSRVRTPKDNPMLERFNWTVQDEWLSLSEVGLDDIGEANRDLTEWLVGYNRDRPHQSLDYQTPLAYAQAFYPEVLPMSSARTPSCVSRV